jgi:hypothetical protein
MLSARSLPSLDVHLPSTMTSVASTIRTVLPKINPISATGFASHNSAFYDQVRPSYPASVLEQVKRELTKGAVVKDLNLLELGSGTVS